MPATDPSVLIVMLAACVVLIAAGAVIGWAARDRRGEPQPEPRPEPAYLSIDPSVNETIRVLTQSNRDMANRIIARDDVGVIQSVIEHDTEVGKAEAGVGDGTTPPRQGRMVPVPFLDEPGPGERRRVGGNLVSIPDTPD